MELRDGIVERRAAKEKWLGLVGATDFATDPANWLIVADDETLACQEAADRAAAEHGAVKAAVTVAIRAAKQRLIIAREKQRVLNAFAGMKISAEEAAATRAMLKDERKELVQETKLLGPQKAVYTTGPRPSAPALPPQTHAAPPAPAAPHPPLTPGARCSLRGAAEGERAG